VPGVFRFFSYPFPSDMKTNSFTSVRSLLEDAPDHDINPALRDLAPEEGPDAPFKARTAFEDKVWSSTPGNEAREGHVFPPSSDGIPYIHTDYAELRRLYNDPDFPAAERSKVADAMRLLGVPFGNGEPVEYRDSDFDFPDHVPNDEVAIRAVDDPETGEKMIVYDLDREYTDKGKVVGHVTIGHNVTKADPLLPLVRYPIYNLQ